MRAYGHSVPAAPGRFARSTGRREAWVSQLVSRHPDRDVTFWDVMSFQRIVERWPHDGPTGGNVRRDAIDTLGNDINYLFSILHWQ